MQSVCRASAALGFEASDVLLRALVQRGFRVSTRLSHMGGVIIILLISDPENLSR